MYGGIEDAQGLVVARVRVLLAGGAAPLLVGVDGQSGAGKTMLSRSLGAELEATVIDGDDFYSGGSDAEWDARCAAEKANLCIDWRRLRREAIEPLLGGKQASWHPFDWKTGEGLTSQTVVARPTPVVILDGAYSTRPEVADLIGLSVLVDVPARVRRQRLIQREGATAVDDWYRRWDDAESYYFTEIRPPSWFDVVVGNPDQPD